MGTSEHADQSHVKMQIGTSRKTFKEIHLGLQFFCRHLKLDYTFVLLGMRTTVRMDRK